MKNREKNRRTKGQQQTGQTETSQEDEKEKTVVFKKGDPVKINDNTVGEIIEVNEKTAVVALGSLLTTVKLERLTKLSGSQAKKIKQNNLKPVIPTIWKTSVKNG